MKKNEPNNGLNSESHQACLNGRVVTDEGKAKDNGLHMAVQHKNEAAEKMTLSEDFADCLMQRIGQGEEAPQQQRFDWMKIAASVIGILCVTGLAFASIHIIRHNSSTLEPQPKEQLVKHQAVLANTNQGDTVILAETIVFNNVSLDSIAKGIAAWHHMNVDLQNEQASQLRFHFVWKPSESLQEVVEKLNMFEHVDIAIEDGNLIVR